MGFMCVPLHMDNQVAMAMIQNEVESGKSKRMHIHCKAVRDCARRGSTSVHCISTAEMAADMLTKEVSPEQHRTCCSVVGMIGLSQIRHECEWQCGKTDTFILTRFVYHGFHMAILFDLHSYSQNCFWPVNKDGQ